MKKLYLFLFSVFIIGSISNASVPGDAGVISVQIMPGACPGLIDVYAEVKNHGATAIDSVFIDWTVNSVPETSLNYQTVINPGDSVTVLIGSSLFLAGVTHDVQAWTRDPNGATDLDQTNDTSMLSGFIPGMNGIYTIGGASPDFMSFTDAIAALNNAGLCGPVEFNVRTGMYTEQIIFPEIAGSSIVNTITFNSELSDSSSVVLTFPAGTSLTENYTMQLNGVDNITFVNMTFERSGTGSASTVVEITNQSDGVSFISNQFLGDASASGSNATGSKSGIYSPITDNNNDLVIRGNYFKDNANGLWINGDGTSHASGMVVENNVFENFYVGAFLLYQTAPQITGNTIIRNNTSSTVDFYGISVRFTEGPLFISKNVVTGHTGNYGIRLRDCVGTMGNEGIIVNNFVQVGGGGTSRGISLEDNCAYQQVYNNSVNNVGTHLTNGTALYVMGPLTTNLDFINNILANAGGGYAVNFVDSSQNGLINSNFNCFFSIGDLGNWFGA